LLARSARTNREGMEKCMGSGIMKGTVPIDARMAAALFCEE